MQERENKTAHSIFLTKFYKASHAHTITKTSVRGQFR